MRAIDLYSGIGGWSLGLKASGVEIVASYEWWQEAALTHHMNLNGHAFVKNIRELKMGELPKDIDIVVGSPPCTQFSYANRGGSGNLSDGLVDIEKFLKVVDFLKPKFWAMENVPRTAKIVIQELESGGELEKYRHLFDDAKIEIFDCSNYGVPQRRKRCIVGNFDLALLEKYSQIIPQKTLGKVMSDLDGSNVQDPNFNISFSRNKISEKEIEVAFSDEEERINKSVKTHHPIYNDMQFPDSLDRPSRTVTATCTRVSRESIVLEYPNESGKYRRLSVRERACLQGFPITYQFYGKSNSSKLKMVGNAIPPIMTYYLAQSFLGTKPEDLVFHNLLKFGSLENVEPGPVTQPDKKGRSYPRGRSFKFAISGLRFKSGMRFELNNSSDENVFKTELYFGSSSRFHSLEPNLNLANRISEILFGDKKEAKKKTFEFLDNQIGKVSQKLLQSTWIKQSSDMHPFVVLDQLGSAFSSLNESSLFPDELDYANGVKIILDQFDEPAGTAKMKKYARDVCLGILVCSYYNELNVYGSTPIRISGTGGNIRPCRKIS